MTSSNEIIRTHNITKTYGTGDTEVKALDHVSITIQKGEFTALVGPSGSGKSTLLNIISGLDQPSAGDVFLSQNNIARLSGSDLSDFRRDHIGFIFQSYNLIPVLTAAENVEYILLIQGVPKKQRDERVSAVFEKVGLKGKERNRPSELSGGQQQRVAVARAMVSRPDIILADEPTANLDSKTGGNLLNTMVELNQNEGMTFVFSTHDERIMECAKRIISLEDGKIVHDQTH